MNLFGSVFSMKKVTYSVETKIKALVFMLKKYKVLIIKRQLTQ